MSSDPVEVVVLAGGKGTRLAAVAGDLPKALVPVAGRPFLDWKLDELARGGATRVHLLVGVGADLIADHLRSSQPPIPVCLHSDGPRLLGTGGALVAYRDQLPDRFVVTYGDSLLDQPLRPFWSAFRRSGLPAALAVTQQLDSDQHGNCEVQDGLVTRYAKGAREPELTWLDYGYLGLERAVLYEYPSGESADLGVIVAALASSRRLGAFRTGKTFWEIGTPQSMSTVAEHLSAPTAKNQTSC